MLNFRVRTFAYVACLTGCITFLAHPRSYAHKQSSPIAANSPKVMTGIKGLEVVVQDIDKDIEALGLEKTSIQTDVKIRLRQAGIQIFNKEKIDPTLEEPDLYVNIQTFKTDSVRGAIFITVDLEFKETVMALKPAGTPIIGARVWHKGKLGFYGNKRIREVREIVKDLTDEFINDYLSANPKQ